MAGENSGGQRPIGIPTFEDKIVQRAVTLLLNAIYEQDFYDFSYGFRPRRSATTPPGAPRTLAAGDIHWIIDADISGCFDNIQHKALQGMVKEHESMMAEFYNSSGNGSTRG